MQLDLRSLRRTQISPEVMIPDVITVETYWNAFHIALYKGHLNIVKFFLEDCRIDASSVGRLSRDAYNSDHSRDAELESFPLFLAIVQGDLEAFKYLWLDHGYFWSDKHWRACVSLVEAKQLKAFVPLLIESKTSHEIFNFHGLQDKVELIEYFLAEDRLYRDDYVKLLRKKPYNWSYLLHRANNVADVDEKEAKAISKVASEIGEHEIEIPDRGRVDHVDSFVRKMSQLDEDDFQFKAFRSVTSKIVKMDKYEKYKADDGKLLTEVSEDNDKDNSDAESDGESDGESDDDSFPSNEEFCQYAEAGRLRKLKAAMEHPEFVGLLSMTGYEKEVTIGDDEHNTELWNALLFAIHANKLDVAKFLMQHSRLNLRLALTNPEKREVEYDDDTLDVEPEDELYGVQIAVSNRQLEMFQLVWDHNRCVWTGEHLAALFDLIVEDEWDAGLKALLESATTHEIFIALRFDNRNELFGKLLAFAREHTNGDGEGDDDEPWVTWDVLGALSKSPYCLSMVFQQDAALSAAVKTASEQFQDSEFHSVIFMGEVDRFVAALTKSKNTTLVDALKQFQKFNEHHFAIKLDEAVGKTLTAKDADLDLFAKNPKFAHLNLHTRLKPASDKTPKFLKVSEWSFPGLALLTCNNDLFDTLVRKYRPMMGMLFEPAADAITDVKGREYASQLHALVEGSGDVGVLYNVLENHSSLFTFKEVYLVTKNVISFGTPLQARILKSTTVQSWFTFVSGDSQIKVSGQSHV